MFNKNKGYETKFDKLNPNELIKKLNIEVKAKEEASKNLPLLDSNEIDVNEYEIKQYISDNAKNSNELVINKKTVYNNILFRITEALSLAKEINITTVKYKNDFSHFISQASDDLNTKKDSMVRAAKDLKNFKLDNNIDREETSSEKPIFHYSILSLIILVESIINSFFFASGSDLGILGGAMQAFIVALLNFMFAMIVFKLYSFFTDIKRSLFYKRILQILIIFMSFFVLIFHLIVGHFRDAISISPEEAYKMSMNTFLNSPFTLESFQSWMLIVIGISIFIFVLFELSKIMDPYPGYSKITEKYIKAKNEFESLKYDVLEEAKNIEEATEENVKSTIRQIKHIYNESRDIPNNLINLEDKYKEHIQHLENIYNLLIKRYRNINISFREDKQRPNYFDRDEILDTFDRISFANSFNNDELKELENIIKNLPEEEARIFNEIIQITKEVKQNKEYFNG